LAAFFVLAFASTASATVMVELPLDELIQRADFIVRGTVVSSGVRMSMDRGGFDPETITVIRVSEWIGSGSGETVQIRELGGVWQGGGRRYDGTPTYTVGEDVIVFLERRPEPPNDLRTLAMVQGKFIVSHGAPGVPSSVARDLAGIAFMQFANGRQTILAPRREPAMELSTFLEFVRRTRGHR
jgi:hypothetical protein